MGTFPTTEVSSTSKAQQHREWAPLSDTHEADEYVNELAGKGEVADVNFMQILETCHTQG